VHEWSINPFTKANPIYSHSLHVTISTHFCVHAFEKLISLSSPLSFLKQRKQAYDTLCSVCVCVPGCTLFKFWIRWPIFLKTSYEYYPLKLPNDILFDFLRLLITWQKCLVAVNFFLVECKITAWQLCEEVLRLSSDGNKLWTIIAIINIWGFFSELNYIVTNPFLIFYNDKCIAGSLLYTTVCLAKVENAQYAFQMYSYIVFLKFCVQPNCTTSGTDL
jgi:hypothetical protein